MAPYKTSTRQRLLAATTFAYLHLGSATVVEGPEGDLGFASPELCEGQLVASSPTQISESISSNDFTDDPGDVPTTLTLLQELSERIRYFRDLGENWDGYGALAPMAESLDRSWDLLTSMLPHISRPEIGKPLVSADSDGTIVLQWFSSSKRVTVSVDGSEVLAIRSWGPNIHTQMDDHEIQTPSALLADLEWLMG